MGPAAVGRLEVWSRLAIFLYIAVAQQWAEGLTITVLNVECVSQWVEHEHDLVTGHFVVVEKNSDWYNEAVDVEIVELRHPANNAYFRRMKMGCRTVSLSDDSNFFTLTFTLHVTEGKRAGSTYVDQNAKDHDAETTDEQPNSLPELVKPCLLSLLHLQLVTLFCRTVRDCIRISRETRRKKLVTGPTGAPVVTSKARGAEKFSFRAARKGHYKFCFHNPTSAPEQISFSIHVGHIPDEAEVAKDEHFNPLEIKIAQIREALENISLEQAYLKRRDIRHKKTNESTRRRLMWYTLMEYLALIAVSIAQVYLIQRLFSKRIGYNKF